MAQASNLTRDVLVLNLEKELEAQTNESCGKNVAE